jgi:hypothetical protein
MTKDLVLLAADNDIAQAILGLLSRPQAIGMRAITLDHYVHPERDPGVRNKSAEFLASFANTHGRALVVLDVEGSGATNAEQIEQQIESNCRARWGDRVRAVAIEPEVEAWVWSSSPEVEQVLGWRNRVPPLRDWLRAEGWDMRPDQKPVRPKEAMSAALRASRTPRSASMFRSLGSRVGVNRCTDRSFLRLREFLSVTFPVT